MNKKSIQQTTNEILKNNASDEEYQLVHSLFSTIQDKSPSDATVDVSIKGNDTNFSGRISVNSANAKFDISRENMNSLEDLIGECEAEFESQISNWRKERSV